MSPIYKRKVIPASPMPVCSLPQSAELLLRRYGIPHNTKRLWSKELFLERAGPLFRAFKRGELGLNDMRNICKGMKVMHDFKRLSTIHSFTFVDMDSRMKELVRIWRVENGWRVANIETLIKILQEIPLQAIAEEIMKDVY